MDYQTLGESSSHSGEKEKKEKEKKNRKEKGKKTIGGYLPLVCL